MDMMEIRRGTVRNILHIESASKVGIITFNCNVESELIKLQLDFRPIQRGTPTSEAPIPIEGWDEIGVGASNENLMPKEPPTKKVYHRTTGGTGSTWNNASNAVACAIIPYPYGQVVRGQKKAAGIAYNVNVGDSTVITKGDRYYDNQPFTKVLNCVVDTTSRKYLNLYSSNTNYFNSAWTTQDVMFSLNAGGRKTYVEPMGTIINLDFPETIYGGHLDLLTGELWKTWEHIASYNGETLPGIWLSNRDLYIEGTAPTAEAEVVYELVAPQLVTTFEPQVIRTLRGVNNIWSNANENLEVSYPKY